VRVGTGYDYHNRVPGMKRLAVRFLTMPVLLPGIEQTTRGTAAIFTLHRFAAFGRPGHDPDQLARNLEWLRRRRYRIVSLHDLVRDALAGRAPRERTVAFTVDDGYRDFAEVAAPIFARYDCPVTVFLITGFLDGGLWMWWDRVRFATEQTRLARGTVSVGSTVLDFSIADPRNRRDLARDLVSRLKVLPDRDRTAALQGLEERLEVSLPATPPPEFGPMSWEQVRQLAGAGVSFGPHSITHPILSRTDDGKSRVEITGSWARLTEELPSAVPIFCWPNGDETSFGPREQHISREIGMIAALSTMPGGLSPSSVRGERGFALPRYAYPADHLDFVQVACGLERMKDFVRTDVTAP
jgi:peptidoglycan/xylan/chitin deacetylase (PgdA/CDA1 family)